MTDISDYGTGERGTFFYDSTSGKLVRKLKAKPVEVNAPAVHGDEIVGGIESWVDGKIYDSKSRLRRSYKELGYIEKGNDRLPPPRRPTDEERYRDIREDAEKAFHDIKNDRVRISEKEREACIQEQRQMEQENQRQKTRWAR